VWTRRRRQKKIPKTIDEDIIFYLYFLSHCRLNKENIKEKEEPTMIERK